MAKMNIYVPDELKARMDDVEGVNWSPLACAAFETELSKTGQTRKIKNMKTIAFQWDQISGEVVRERLVRNGIEETERRYVKYVKDFGKEPVVFVFNLLDPFGRMFAEGHASKDEVERRINHADPQEITPVFYFLCGIENAQKLTSTGEFNRFGELPAFPIPNDMFLVVGISHEGMLFRWLPKPQLS